MTTQTNLLDAIEEAETLRLSGMHTAEQHAERVIPTWSEQALNKLKSFLASHSEPFMTEDYRQWAEQNGLPVPPSGRAYGSIMVKAQSQGLIRFYKYSKTTNPNAHRTPATQWQRA